MHHTGSSLEQGIHRLNRESGGLLRLEIIRPEEISRLSYAVFCGDAGAFARLNAALESAARIRRQARKKPVVCLCCPRSIRDPRATLALLIPACDAASIAIASALCDRCSTAEQETLMVRTVAAYQAIWPQLRRVDITHPEGGSA